MSQVTAQPNRCVWFPEMEGVCVCFPEMEGVCVCVWSAQWTGMELMAELQLESWGQGGQ